MDDDKRNDTLDRDNLFLISEIEENSPKMSFLDILSKLSPGKPFREALDQILTAECGALIVIDSEKLKDVFQGGFRVNCKFSPQKLAELAKMDGAIVISSDFKKILHANTLLVPDTRIPSNETGTRHMASERTAIQTGTPVIAVSERRGKITLFYENRKYVLQDSETLLRRATENLQILEKQREILDDLVSNLNILEVTNLVSVGDVCIVLQRIEIIIRIMATLKRHLIELGKEGVIIRMRVRELSKGIEEIEKLILKDYVIKPANIQKMITSINFDGLLDLNALIKIIFDFPSDTLVSPCGYRLLSKINITSEEKEVLINNFKNIGNLLKSNSEDLLMLLGERMQFFRKEMESLKEQIMVGKKI